MAAMITGEKSDKGEVIPVAKILSDIGCRVRWIDLDKRSWSEPLPKGHDAADLDWPKSDIDQLMKFCMTDWAPLQPDPEPEPDIGASSSDEDLAPVEQEEPTEVAHKPDESWMQRLTSSLNAEASFRRRFDCLTFDSFAQSLAKRRSAKLTDEMRQQAEGLGQFHGPCFLASELLKDAEVCRWLECR